MENIKSLFLSKSNFLDESLKYRTKNSSIKCTNLNKFFFNYIFKKVLENSSFYDSVENFLLPFYDILNEKLTMVLEFPRERLYDWIYISYISVCLCLLLIYV